MGANSKQGWCVFTFLTGFTSLVAGLAYLGVGFTLVGLVLLIGSLAGFYQIKSLEDGWKAEKLTLVGTPPAAKK